MTRRTVYEQVLEQTGRFHTHIARKLSSPRDTTSENAEKMVSPDLFVGSLIEESKGKTAAGVS